MTPGVSDLQGVRLTFVDDLDDVFDFRSWLSQRRASIAIDTETSGLHYGRDRVRLVQIGDRDHGWAFPVDGARSWYGLVSATIAAMSGTEVLMHNSIFDSTFLERDGVRLPWPLIGDTMVKSHLDQSNLSAALKSVASREVSRAAVVGQGALSAAVREQGWDWGTIPFDFPAYSAYGALDTVLTCRIDEALGPRVADQRRSYDLEMAAIRVLSGSQRTGMRVDVDYCLGRAAALRAELDSLRPGLPCNPNSEPQLVKWLRSRSAPLTKLTEKGNLSVDDQVLASLEARIPECGVVRRYRAAEKLLGSYFENLLSLHEDGVVHPSIRVLGASRTGRMSITAPALQTLPKTRVGRAAFVAREGHVLISADFKGLEMRLMAHSSGDENLLAAFRAGVDPHVWTAQEAYHVAVPSVVQRAVAKSAGFGKVFGSGLETFCRQTGLADPDGAAFLARYDELFPGIKRFQAKVINEVHSSTGREEKWGFVRTEFGRRLYVPKEKAYQGIAYHIQGTAAEILKAKIGELDAAGVGDLIRLPVHDELIFEPRAEDASEVRDIVGRVMREPDWFQIPLEVDVSEPLRSWGDAYD